MEPLAAAQFNQKTREIILGESGPYHPDWERVLIFSDKVLKDPGLRHAKNAEETLQKMLNSHNTENPWLGIAASVALLQQRAYAASMPVIIREDLENAIRAKWSESGGVSHTAAQAVEAMVKYIIGLPAVPPAPLYCDVCDEELQRESCNHVRACVKCAKQTARIVKGVLPQVRLNDDEESAPRPMPHVMRGEVRAADENENWVRVKTSCAGVRIGERVAIVPLERDCQCGCDDCPICVDVRNYVAEVLKERHPAAPVEEKPEPDHYTEDNIPADWLRWRIYRHQDSDHKEYTTARFPEGRIHGADTFMLRGHRWKYAYSSFDDGGEYDILVRPRATKEQFQENAAGEKKCIDCGAWMSNASSFSRCNDCRDKRNAPVTTSEAEVEREAEIAWKLYENPAASQWFSLQHDSVKGRWRQIARAVLATQGEGWQKRFDEWA